MGKKILLADDSLTIQKVVELTLAGTGYELTCVSNGQKALESLERSRPDVILADVVMPEKNGYEVCEAVKSDPATAGIPVLLLSGTFEPFDRERADRVKADRVVPKPFDAQQLLDQIEALLSRAPGAAAADAAPSRETHEDAAFLDDTIPTGRAAVRVEEGRTEEYREPAEPGGVGEAEPAGGEAFSGGPFFLPTSATAPPAEETAAPRAGETPETPAPAPPPAGPAESAPAIEEISEEEAEAFFDVAPAAAPPSPGAPAAGGSELTQDQIERIAALVVAKLSDKVLREIAWEVVPDVAEMVVKRRIEELESGVE